MTNMNTNATVYVVICRDWFCDDFSDSVVRVFRTESSAQAFCAEASEASGCEYWWTEMPLE